MSGYYRGEFYYSGYVSSIMKEARKAFPSTLFMSLPSHCSSIGSLIRQGNVDDIKTLAYLVHNNKAFPQVKEFFNLNENHVEDDKHLSYSQLLQYRNKINVCREKKITENE